MAASLTYKKVKYTMLDDTTVCVAKNVKFSGPLEIPEIIEKNGSTYRVTEIEIGAFSGSGITSVVIPGSIKKVTSYSFEKTPLESVALNEGTERIEVSAFQRCKITSVRIPGSVTVIEGNSFGGCELLESVDFVNPAAVSEVALSSFDGTKWQSEQLAKTGILIIGSTLLSVDTDEEKYKVPEGVTHVSPDAFIKCTALKEISLPEGITELRHSVFNQCRSVERINLPASLKKIGVGAKRGWTNHGTFNGCSSLKEIAIPEGVEEIGAMSFEGCCSLERILLPKTVHLIGREAFKGCSSLKEVQVPEGVETIQEATFEGCVSLSEVHLPGTLAKIEKRVFMGCHRLSAIMLPGSVKEIGAQAFWECYDLSAAVLPDGLEAIQDGAFGCCNHLVSISVPKTVNHIGKYAFWSCCGLREATLPEGVFIDKTVFINCNSIGKAPGKNLPDAVALEIVSDPYDCECRINLSDKEAARYMNEAYSSLQDDGFEPDCVSFIKWGCYRGAALDGKEVSVEGLFNRPMDFHSTLWEDHFDDLQEVLSHLMPGRYGVIDRRVMSKSRTIFNIALNGAPFNKSCLKLLRMSREGIGSPNMKIQQKLIPDMSLCGNKLLYCGVEVYGEFVSDMGSQGAVQRFVFRREEDGSINVVGEYTY